MWSGAPRDERRHAGAAVEEWVFALWNADGSLGVICGHRVLGPRAWYWAAVCRSSGPLLHVEEWDVPVRSDPSLVKAPGLWAEHTCEAPYQQWTVGAETFAAALDEPDDALGRGYGTPTPLAFDLEWYATASPTAVTSGYHQTGVVHGAIDLGRPPGDPADERIERIELAEVPARRWHRWGLGLAPVELEPAFAHTGRRAPFAFPDGTVLDLVLVADGWRARR